MQVIWKEEEKNWTKGKGKWVKERNMKEKGEVAEGRERWRWDGVSGH